MKTIAIAKGNNIRISPRKARLVIDQIRGLNVVHALAILQNTQRRVNPIIKNILQSAIANAIQREEKLDPDHLIISKAWVDKGFTLKRMRPRAMGRGATILKRNSHITLAVGNLNS